MKFIHNVALAAIAFLTSTLSAELASGVKATELAKEDAQFATFVKEIVEASKNADVERLKKITIIGEAERAWKKTQMGLKIMNHVTVKSTNYEIDPDKKVYEKKGVEWELSAPANGELKIVFKVEKEGNTKSAEMKVRFMVAKTTKGWCIVLPTKKKSKKSE